MNNSQKAYHEIKDDGTLAKMEYRALYIISRHGPINGRILDDHMDGGHKRIRTLLERGLIAIAYNDVDPVTNKTTAYYHATGNKPLPRKVSVKKPLYKNDPKALAHLYDKSFEAGVRAALSYVYNGTVSEVFVDLICGVQK